MQAHFLQESHILLFLVQMFILLSLTRAGGELFRRIKQPPLTAEMLVGVLLGPTILGRFFPEIHGLIFPPDLIQQNMIETVAWIGVMFLLLETGLEIDFSIAWRQRGSAMTIALSDVIIPMVVAFVPCMFLPDVYLTEGGGRWAFALFMATAMTISAMPVAARALHDLNLLKTELGFLIMSALAVNDIIGWVLFTIVLGLFTQTAVSFSSVSVLLAATVGFSALALTVGRSFTTRVISFMQEKGLPEPAASLTLICLLGILFGAITQLIGIHALFGFFIAGVAAGEAKTLSEKTRTTISQMVYTIFVPIFFASIGLKLDFVQAFDLPLVAFVTVIGIAGRFLGAWFGVSWTPMSNKNRHAIAVAHTPGGMMEIVVALLAFETGLITQAVFIAVVFGAIFSSMLAGPWLAWAIRSRQPSKILDFLHERLVFDDIKASTPAEAIQRICDAISGIRGMPSAESICGKVIERENLFGTGLEHGVAIPHARVEGLPRPVIAFARSRGGIDWDSPDGEHARFIFFVLVPSHMDSLQIQLLAEIACAMMPEKNREALAAAEGGDQLMAALRRALIMSSSESSPCAEPVG